MAEGTFNISAWAQRMGLKNLRELPFIERIQPTVTLGEMKDLMPQYRPPAALFGQTIAAVAGQGAACEITALGPGGAVVEAVWFSTAAGSLRAQTAAPPALAVNAVPVALLSNQAPLTLVRFGTMVPAGPSALVLQSLITWIGPLLWYIRPGDTLRLINPTVFSQGDISVVVRDVPASEAGPNG